MYIPTYVMLCSYMYIPTYDMLCSYMYIHMTCYVVMCTVRSCSFRSPFNLEILLIQAGECGPLYLHFTFKANS